MARQHGMPAGIDVAGGVHVGGEVVAIIVKSSRGVNGVVFLEKFSVDEHCAFLEADPVPGQSDHAFHKMFRRIDRVVKDYNVATPDFPVGHQPIPYTTLSK